MTCHLLKHEQELIHSADPQSRPVVIIVFARDVRPYVSPHFSKCFKTKQLLNENSDHFSQYCGSGRADH